MIVRICQADGCVEKARWRLRNYWTRGSIAERKHGTTSRLLCDEHKAKAAGGNPFHVWERYEHGAN